MRQHNVTRTSARAQHPAWGWPITRRSEAFAAGEWAARTPVTSITIAPPAGSAQPSPRAAPAIFDKGHGGATSLTDVDRWQARRRGSRRATRARRRKFAYARRSIG
ncbi:Hypothetical protein A7982_05460 [Minicystis rosea]|nr:Hypothetical protein A7982_05460 [Minicystis rosea]